MDALHHLRKKISFTSAKEAQLEAAFFAKGLPADVWVFLEGDVGAGKTNWVKGMAQAFGIRKTITSPSFGLYNIYEGERMLVHMDAYRLDKEKNIDAWTFEDFLTSPYAVVVEWPNKLNLDALGIKPSFIVHFWIEEGKHYVQLL